MSISKEFLSWVKSNYNPAPLQVEVGFMPQATYNNQEESGDTIYVAAVAYKNNYGIGVPARPFMDKAINKIDYVREFEEFYKDSGDISYSLNAIGTQIKQAIQREIIDLKEPPNSKRTIELKGSSNPLVDTGHMGDSVTYIVKDNRE